MKEENRMAVIEKLEGLLRMTRAYETLQIRRGKLDYSRKDRLGRPLFAEEAGDIFELEEPCLLLAWEGQDDLFGVRVPVGATSASEIIRSVAEALGKL